MGFIDRANACIDVLVEWTYRRQVKFFLMAVVLLVLVTLGGC